MSPPHSHQSPRASCLAAGPGFWSPVAPAEGRGLCTPGSQLLLSSIGEVAKWTGLPGQLEAP
jgi:hypothetical protein